VRYSCFFFILFFYQCDVADLIFILLDKPDESRDRQISEHIMKTHFLANNQGGATSGPSEYGGAAFTQHQQTQMHTQYADQDVTLAQRLRRQIKDLNKHQHHSQQHSASSSSQQAFSASSSMVPHGLLTRYIEYAKRYAHPRLTKPAAKVLQKMYLTMRSEASLGNSMPVTTRHLESLIRLSQARARLELREEVSVWCVCFDLLFYDRFDLIR
jgi:DNA helicase MCM8